MTSAALFVAWVLSDPPPGDAYRLPPLAVLTEGRRFNCRYRAQLKSMAGFDPGRWYWYRVAVAENDWLYEVWDAAEGAHPHYQCSAEAKAYYLRKLRLSLGRDAYRRMELPTCVPYWRFNELR